MRFLKARSLFVHGFAKIALFLCLFSVGCLAHAAYLPWSERTHTLYEGDFNGDGIADLYLKPNHRYIPIVGGVTFFIAHLVQPFLLLGDQYGGFELFDNVSESELKAVQWQLSDYQKHLADFNGDGLLDYFLQPDATGEYGIVLVSPSSGQAAYISQLINFEEYGFLLSQGEVKLHFTDLNGDGFADVILQARQEQSTTKVLISNAGTFDLPANGSGGGMPQYPEIEDETTHPKIEDYALNELIDSIVSSEQDLKLDLTGSQIVAGTIVGEFDVTPSGAASYRIPIEVPPSTGGTQPQLGLVYRSGSFEGHLGAGWSIDGLSSIHRCEKNKVENGTSSSVGFGVPQNTLYCLGGDQLALIGAFTDPDTQQAGNEYRTKNESFSRVVSFGDVHKPSHWKVWHKNGGVFEYGATEDSAIAAVDGAGVKREANILLWLVNKSSDRHGNYSQYEYVVHESGEFYIDSILYGRNDTISLLPIYKVEFQYIDRGESRILYAPAQGQTGIRRTISSLLKRVRVITSDSLTSTYEIGYKRDPASRAITLEKVARCAFESNGVKSCFSPTSFNYSGESVSPALVTESRQITGRTPSSFFNRDFFVDVNEDGKVDLISVSANSGGKATARVFLVTAAGGYSLAYSQPLTTTVSNLSRVLIQLSQIDGRIYINELDLQSNLSNAVRFAVWSLSGSNMIKLTDSAVPTPNFNYRGAWGVDSSPGIKTSNSFSLFDFSDYGLELYREKLSGTLDNCNYARENAINRTYVSYADGNVNVQSSSNVYYKGRTIPPDWEYRKVSGRDGYAVDSKDCYFPKYGGWPVVDPLSPFGGVGHGNIPLELDYYATAGRRYAEIYPKEFINLSGYNATSFGTGAFYSSFDKRYLAWADINRDGMDDLIILYQDGQQASVNFHLNQKGFANSPDDMPVVASVKNVGSWIAGSSNRGYKVLGFNYNDDQMIDLVVMRYQGNDLYMDVYPSTQAGYSAADKISRLIKSGVATDEKYEFYAQDLDGTGAPQLVGLSSKTGSTIIISRSDWEPLMVSKITTGLGDSVDITYSPLISDVHDYEPILSDRENLYAPLSGLYVVSSVATSAATSQDRPTSYPYQSTDSESVCYEATHHVVDAYTYDEFVVPGYCTDGYWLEPYEVTTEVCSNGVCVTDTYLTEAVFVPSKCYPQRTIPGGTIAGFEISSPAYCVAPDPNALPGSLDAPFVAGSELASPADKQRSVYHYAGFKAHSKGFGALGFRKVTKTDVASGVKTVATFSQDYANRLHGRLLTSQTYAPSGSGMQLIKSVDNTWSKLDWADGRYFIFLKATSEKSWELDGTLMSDASKEMTIDLESNMATGVGNVVAVEAVQRDGTASITSLTESKYEQDDLSSWLIGRPTRTTVTKTLAGTEYAGQSVHVTARTFDETTGSLRSVTSEPIEYSASANPVWAKKEYVYNDAGLVDTVTESGADIEPIVTKYEYDSAYRWETKKTIAFGNAHYQRSIGTKPHPVLGKPMTLTDSNGLKTYTVYDAFGRVILQSNPDGTYVQTNYVRYRNSYAAYYVETLVSDGSGSRIYFDRKDRKIHERSIGTDGRTVYQDTLYDSQGREVRTSLPYLGGTQTYWNRVLQFDALGRPAQTLAANGAYGEVTRQGRTATTTNVKQQSKVETVDGFGQTVSITEYKDGTPVTLEYKYDVDGNLRETADTTVSPKISVTSQFNILGQAYRVSDPNSGIWNYDYDVAGKLIRQTDANGVSTCFAYDLLGRKIKQVGNYTGTLAAAKNKCSGATNTTADISEWYYDSAQGASVGHVHKVLGSYNHANGTYAYQEEYFYDDLSRPTKVIKLIDGATYETSTSYYGASEPAWKGKVKDTTYPSAIAVEYRYNGAGVLSQLVNPHNQTLYWEMLSANAFGKVTAEKLGNGVKSIKDYNPTDATVSRIYSTLGLSTSYVFDHEYEFDQLGNLEVRRDVLGGTEESFAYDDLNRLDLVNLSYKVSNQTASATFDYESSLNGNLRSRPEVATTEFQYGAPVAGCPVVFAGPHAITRAGTTTYCYDRNGSVVRRGSDVIQYNYARKSTYITSGSNSSRFTYGPSQERYKRVDMFGGNQTTTVYVGSYEKVVVGSNVKEKHYIGGVAVVTLENGFQQSVQYLHKDHLGSVIGITDQSGVVKERYSFDSWGRRRSASWAPLNSSGLNQLVASIVNVSATTLGYTGHEMLDNVGLIHMNGRIYDPLIGRMLSADPVTSDPRNLQTYNRYSYVQNNPLKLIDPTGYYSDDLGNVQYGIGYNSNGGLYFEVGNSGGFDYQKMGVMDYSFNPSEYSGFYTAGSYSGYGANLSSSFMFVSPTYGTYNYFSSYGDISSEFGVLSSGGASDFYRAEEYDVSAYSYPVDYIQVVGSAVKYLGETFPGGIFGHIVRSVEDREMTLEEAYKISAIAGMGVGSLTTKGTGLVVRELGGFSAYAQNGVGGIFSPNVTIAGKNIFFNEFSIGTQKGFLGVGPKGAAELVGPMKELINFSQRNGASTITLSGRYAMEEGAALGGGKVGDSFSFSFPATNQGFKEFLETLR